MESEIKVDLKRLNDFLKAINSPMAVKIGVLSKKAGRQESGPLNNPTIGFKHEFGSPAEGIPKRSFLLMPLHQKSAEIIKKVAPKVTPALVAKNPLKLMNLLGVACVAVIQDAFATRGFGTWKPNAPSTIRRKKSNSPLIDTAQLRRSITWEVLK